MKHHHVRRKGWFCWIKNDTKDGNKIWSGSRVGVKGLHRPLLPFIFILVSSSTLHFCCWYMFKKKPCVGNCCQFICMYEFLKLLTTPFQTQTSTNCQSLDWYFCSKKKFGCFWTILRKNFKMTAKINMTEGQISVWLFIWSICNAPRFKSSLWNNTTLREPI